MNWPTLIIAIAALLSAIVASVAVWLEGLRMRRQLGINNMWRLIEKWDEPRLRAHRSAAARQLLEDSQHREDLPVEALELLDMFELLAYLVVRSKTLSLEDAWINFSGPAIQWWYICRPGIERFQADDPTIYEDFATLADELIELEAKRRDKDREELKPSEEDLRAFLQGEVLQEGDRLLKSRRTWWFWR